jgi:hypothetical protein
MQLGNDLNKETFTSLKSTFALMDLFISVLAILINLSLKKMGITKKLPIIITRKTKIESKIFLIIFFIFL